MLHIGQFSDTFLPIVDGVGRVTLAYAETLCKLGHQVTVVSPMYDTGYRGGYPFELVDFVGTGLPGMKQYKVGEAPWDSHYRRRMKMIPLDIVHSHSPFTAGSEALRLAVLRKLPLVSTFHSKYYDDFYKATKSEKLATAGVKFVVDYYDRCDEVWTASPATADVLRRYGYQGPIQIMPLGINLREKDESAVAEVTRLLNLGEDPVILYVGQLNWKKNILTILEACAQLKKAGAVFKLVLAGQGPDREEIQQKAEDLNLLDRTILPGHITNTQLLDGLYARATIFAFPSLYDTAGMVVREAAIMGTPSVVIRGSNAADGIKNGKNGYLCRNTAEDLAKTLRDALDNPNEAARLGESARETIPVPWETIMQNAVKRYQHLIKLGREGKLNRKSLRIV